MSDIFELGIGISFPEGEYTKEQVDTIAEAFLNLQKVAESAGGTATPAMSAFTASVSDLASSMSESLSSAVGSDLGAQFMSSFADKVTASEKPVGQLGEALCSAAECADGLAESAGEAAEALSGVADKVTDVGSKADQLSPLSQILRGLTGDTTRLERKLAEDPFKPFEQLESFGGAPATANLSTTLRDLEHASHQMAVGLGMGGERAQYMRSEMLQLGATTQFSIGEITRLSQQLHNTGRGLDEFSVGTQQNMIALNDIFQVSGEDISRAERTVASFGGSLEDTLDQTAEFQAQFQVPGMFQALPQVIDHAQHSVVTFGKAVVGSGQQVMGNITKQAGVFAKTYGKTIADAVGDATSAFDMFAAAAKTNRRVFLGLESDFDPLQKAFMEVGVPLWESSKLIENAMSDSETAIFDFVTAARNQFLAMEGSPMGDRFIEQLRDQLPPAVMEAITEVDRYKQMRDAVAEAERRSSLETIGGKQAFEDLSNEMLNTTQELQKMWFNVKQLIGATLVQTGVMDGLKSAFGAAKDIFAGFASSLETFIRSEGFQEWADRIKPVIKVVGAGILTIGAAVGGLVSAIGTLSFAPAVWGGMVKRIADLTGGFARLAPYVAEGRGIVTEGLGIFGRGVKYLFSPITKLGEMVLGLGQRFMGLTPVTKSVEKLGEAARFTGGAFANVFGAAKKKSFEWATNGATKLSGAFSALGKKFPALATGFGKLGGLAKFITGAFKNVGGSLIGVLGKGFGFIAKRGLKAIPIIGTVISAVSGVLTALEDMGSVLGDPSASGVDKFAAVLRGTIKGLGNFINGMLLGIPGFIADIFFPDMEKKFDEGFGSLFSGLSGMDVGSAISKVWDSVTGWFAEKLSGFSDWIVSRLPDWKEMAASWGETIGGAVGGLARMLIDGLIWGIKNLNPVSVLMTTFEWIFTMALGDGAAAGIEAGGPSILQSIGNILMDLGGVVLSAMGGIADGILGAFGSSLDEMLVGFQMVWWGIKRGFAELAMGIFNRVSWLAESIIKIGLHIWSGLDMGLVQPIAAGVEWAAGLISNKFDIAFATMKAAGLSFVAFFGPSLIGVVNEAVGAIKLLVGTANLIPGLRGSFDDVLAGIDAAQVGMNKFITDAPAAALAAANELKQLEEKGAESFGTILMRREKESADLLKERLASVDAFAKSRQEGTQRYRDETNKELSQLEQQVNAAADRKRERADWNRIAREERDGLADVLQLMKKKDKADESNAAFHALNTQSQKQASDAFSTYMDETIRNLSAGIRDGTITMEKAVQALADAKVQGVKDAIAGAKRAQDAATGQTPGDVADGAAFDMSKYAVTPQMVQGLMVALNKGALARGQAVAVTLRGDGPVTKALARSQTKAEKLRRHGEGNQ